jgi:hypothetical protein
MEHLIDGLLQYVSPTLDEFVQGKKKNRGERKRLVVAGGRRILLFRHSYRLLTHLYIHSKTDMKSTQYKHLNYFKKKIQASHKNNKETRT